MHESELPLRPDGSIYHLAIRPGQASHRCILVGDPERVSLAEPLMERIEFRGGNREFRWITGIYKGASITVVGTGIGPDNTEIALLELDAVHNIDLSRRQPFPTQKKMYFLRIGTSGLVQPEVPVGTAVFTRIAIGIDAMPLFYGDSPISPATEALQHYWYKRTGRTLPWYVVEATPFFQEMYDKVKIEDISTVSGITYTAPGFYAPQGRTLRRPVAFPQMPWLLSHFSYGDEKVQNIEMEASCLYLLARLLGHEAGALCLGVAHRLRGEMLYGNGSGMSPQQAITLLLKAGLEWLSHAP
ncbi:MAG: phosphorylase [Bacteroidia bacterium]|nr:phosphorylase [Bacteroidia bacterium]MDW8235582.1 phosphorylase [Bacteroidia bacterium]